MLWKQKLIKRFNVQDKTLLSHALSGEVLGIINQNPSVSKSNRLHNVISRFLFIYYFGVDSTIPSQPILKSWTSTGYFSNSTGSSVTTWRSVLPVHWHLFWKFTNEHTLVNGNIHAYNLELIKPWKMSLGNMSTTWGVHDIHLKYYVIELLEVVNTFNSYTFGKEQKNKNKPKIYLIQAFELESLVS